MRFLTPPVSSTSHSSRPANVSDVDDITADESSDSVDPLNCIPVSDPYLESEDGLSEDVSDWGAWPTCHDGGAKEPGIVADDEQNCVVSWPSSPLRQSYDSPSPSQGPHIVADDLDLSMLSFGELTALDYHQRDERRRLKIAMLIKEGDRRKAMCEMGNKALMKVEKLMRMMKMYQAAE